MFRSVLLTLALGMTILTACRGPTATNGSRSGPAATSPPAATATIAPPPQAPTPSSAATTTSATAATNTPATPPTPAATATPRSSPAQTQAPAGDATATPSPEGSGGTRTIAYQDDRSGPVQLMESYVNAINLKQYLRAYSYWENAGASSNLPSFEQFQQGFAKTASVELTLGRIGSDAGAGNVYYAVPATLISRTTDGARQTFVGCYSLHQVNPAVLGAPPFRPLAIASVDVKQVAEGADTAGLMAKACDPRSTSPLPPSVLTPTKDPSDISTSRYLDDRSDAVQVLRSLFNAVNRHEYVRAYSYWEDGSTDKPPFDQFQQGYERTASVQLTTGKVADGVGAGNAWYDVPVVLTAKTTDGQTQTFVGCYRLHLGSPYAQGVVPFQPLGIASAKIQQVAGDANTSVFLSQTCN